MAATIVSAGAFRFGCRGHSVFRVLEIVDYVFRLVEGILDLIDLFFFDCARFVLEFFSGGHVVVDLAGEVDDVNF